jgi:hypothetical protein
MKFVIEIIVIAGGLPDFLGAFSSSGIFSVPVVSMSMSLVLRGAKKLRVGTAFGDIFTAATTATDFSHLLCCVKYY